MELYALLYNQKLSTHKENTKVAFFLRRVQELHVRNCWLSFFERTVNFILPCLATDMAPTQVAGSPVGTWTQARLRCLKYLDSPKAKLHVAGGGL